MTKMTEPAPQSIPVRRDWLRRLVWGMLALLLLPPLLLTLLLLGLDTQAGRSWLVQTINRSGTVQIASLDGSLWSRMVVNAVRVDLPDVHLEADRLELAWMPYSLLLKRVHFTAIKAGEIDLALKPSPPDKAPSGVPDDLSLPIALAVDAAEIGTLRLHDPELVFSSIHFNLSSTGRHHRIELAQLVSAQGRAQAGLTLDSKQPFASSGRFDFRGEVEGQALHTQGTLQGELRNLNLNARIENPRARGSVQARLDLFAPYAYQMLREGRVELDRVDPARVMPGLPQAELDIRLDLHPTGADSAKGRLTVTNHRPGPVNANQVPVETLVTDLAYAGETLHFSRLDARMRGGRIAGGGWVGGGRLALEAEVSALDLARLWSRQPATSLSGKLSLLGPWLAPDIRADLSEARRQVSLKADLGWINPQREQRLQIRQALLQRGASRISGRGEFALDGRMDFRLTGDFSRFNPAEYVALPAGSLTGGFSAEGALLPRPAVSLDYRLADSRFNGEPLQGQGRLRLEETRLADADFWLMLGRNRVEVRGALGGRNDVLQATLDLPALQSLGKEFAGSAHGNVRVSGSFADPVLAGRITMQDLVTPFGVSIGRAEIDAQLQQGMQSPMQIRVDAAQVQSGDLLLDRVQVQMDGSRGQHAGSIVASGSAGTAGRVQLQMSLAGGLDAQWFWQGRLQQFALEGPQVLRLSGPATLQAGSTLVSLGDSRWQLGRANLHLQQTRWQPGMIETRGALSQLPLVDWLRMAGASDFSSDLMLGGQWQLKLDQDLRDLNGMIRLARENGDSLWRGPAGNRIPFELQDAWLQMDVRHNRVMLDGLIRSSRYGRVGIGGETRINPASFQIADGAAVSLSARGELPQLSAFNPLLGPDLQLGGRVAFDVRRDGLRQDARLSGTIQGDELAIRDLATGANLRDGMIRMALADQRIMLQQALFKGGQGDLRAEGVLDLREETPSGQARVEANRLTLFSRSDMLLVISGSGDLTSQKGQISVSGSLRADQGDIEYRSADIPKLSDDVVVLGRGRAQPRALPGFTLSVDVDLGNDFRFRGYGLDAKLEGLLRLRAQPARALAANGVVRVRAGTYRAWGQRLEIERGQLSFQGPVENPGLDILAMRRNQAVEAGVSVLGTAMNPRVQLYSEPSVPDTEKLSWLLFGHGTEGMEKSDAALLLQAAHSLLAGNTQGKGLTEEILETIGIDDVGMRSVRETDGKSTQIVTVSKQLGRNLRISLEKSLTGLRDAVKLSLQLSRRWALVSRVGNDESSVGATYTIQFD